VGLKTVGLLLWRWRWERGECCFVLGTPRDVLDTPRDVSGTLRDVQGYLAHKKLPPPQHFRRALGIGLL